jgi:AcrR family transcriptional regulator
LPVPEPRSAKPRPETKEALPESLCRAAAEVITEKGLGGFSLREVARRAGVSHAAPGYHFGDTAGLLTVLAVQGFNTLTAETRAAVADVDEPVDQLVAIARTYVKVARTYPAHCEVIWRDDLINTDDAAYSTAGREAFSVLVQAIENIAAKHNPDLDVIDAALLCWSSVQGQVVLHSKLARFAVLHQPNPDDAAGELAERLTRLMASGLTAG